MNQLVSNNKANAVIINLIAIGVLGYLSKYGLNIVLSHFLEPSLYGDFNLAIRVLAILSSVALLGTNNTAKRFLSSYLLQEKHLTLQNYIHWNMKLIRWSFILCLAVGITAFVSMKLAHVWHFKEIRTYHLAIYMLWVAPIAAAVTLLGSYILCTNHLVFNTILQNAKNPLCILAFLMFALLIKAPLDSFTMLMVLLLSYLIIVVTQILFILKKTPELSQHLVSAIYTKDKPVIHPDWLSASTKLALNGLLCPLIFSIDLMVIEIVLPNKTGMGLYAAALTIGASLLVISQNSFYSVKTHVSHLVTSDEGKKKLEQMFKRVNRICVTFTLLLAAILFIFSKTFLLHFGPAYLEAELTLKILIIGFTFGSFTQSATTLLAYSGNEAILLKMSIIELITLASTAVVFTYFYGIQGTAVATSLSIIAKAVAFHVVAYLRTHVRAYIL